eukprot:5941999-Prymnesium_polylepis.1
MRASPGATNRTPCCSKSALPSKPLRYMLLNSLCTQWRSRPHRHACKARANGPGRQHSPANSSRRNTRVTPTTSRAHRRGRDSTPAGEPDAIM